MFRDLIDHILDILKELFSKEETWVILFIAGFGAVFIFLPRLNTGTFLGAILKVIGLTWWLILFFILYKAFESLWLFWRRQIFQNIKTPCKIMEIKIPREILKTPKAMEQVLLAIHGLRNVASDPQEFYWDGEITRWYSLEMVSFGGEIHYYIRFYEKQINLIQAAFFAHYPDLELIEVEDYINRVPATVEEVYAAGDDIWGAELVLEKPSAYPIRSFTEFFDVPDEDRRLDPMGTFVEVLSKVKKDDFVGLQIIITPASDNWKEKEEHVLEELKEKTSRQVVSEEDDSGTPRLSTRTPGETDLIRDIENNLSKPGFETVIRFAYISKKEGFYDSYPRRGIRGAFNQYRSIGRNTFIMNPLTSTLTKIWYPPYIFPKVRVEYRKRRLLHDYRLRETPLDTFMGKIITSYLFSLNTVSKSFVLSTEGVATLFHPPTSVVLTAPHIPRTESRRAGPPSGLPIFGVESDFDNLE